MQKYNLTFDEFGYEYVKFRARLLRDRSLFTEYIKLVRERGCL